ncbi:MAG: methyltransferase domain-containing protein [Anaerolineae bacterium]|nr:methyltransferase domain-containing protein [Anaerolineae bacterium]
MLLWRWASRRYLLPCPTWLARFLENPVVKGMGTQSVLDRLDLRPGMNVLDVGCGPGRLAIPIAARVGPTGQVVALDVQAEMLRRAQARAQAAGLENIRFVHAGAGQGKVERGVFDRALLVTVLGEIPDRRAALQEIFDALKPGGVLSVTEVIPDPHYESQNTVRRLAATVGFTEQSCSGNWLAYTMNLVKPER